MNIDQLTPCAPPPPPPLPLVGQLDRGDVQLFLTDPFPAAPVQHESQEGEPSRNAGKKTISVNSHSSVPVQILSPRADLDLPHVGEVVQVLEVKGLPGLAELVDDPVDALHTQHAEARAEKRRG